MANYLRSYLGKKKERLDYWECRLLDEMRFGVTPEVERLVEKVREAQLAVLKDRRASILQNGVIERPLFEKIDARVAQWKSKSTDEIIDDYQKKLPVVADQD
jgi:hypothetical protein